MSSRKGSKASGPRSPVSSRRDKSVSFVAPDKAGVSKPATPARRPTVVVLPTVEELDDDVDQASDDDVASASGDDVEEVEDEDEAEEATVDDAVDEDEDEHI